MSKQHQKYTDIIRFGKDNTFEPLTEAKLISITEKIDGANSSFIYDPEAPNGVQVFSRNKVCSSELNLRGFYEWVQETIVPIKTSLNEHYRYFGEWLVPHKVIYKPDCYNNFYLFSIWDENKQEYLPDSIIKPEAQRLGLKAVPYLYEGEFISINHILQFVGKSEMTKTKDTGEGVVVKNVEYRGKDQKQLFVKFISDEFAEITKQKQVKPDTKCLLDMIVTPNRIEKMLSKLIDEGVIPANATRSDMGFILKEMNSALIHDILKEEADTLEGIKEGEIARKLTATVPRIVKSSLFNWY